MTTTPSRRRSRRRRAAENADSGGHSGVRCRMCGQVVEVDEQGRCRLGHMVLAAEEMTERRQTARRQEDLAEQSPSMPPALQTPRDALSATPTDVGPMIPEEAPSPDPVHRRPTPTAAQIRRREMTSQWVPGVAITTSRLDTAAYLTPTAAVPSRQPDVDVPLPVMDVIPPLPVPDAGSDALSLPLPPIRQGDAGEHITSALHARIEPAGQSWSLEDLSPMAPSALDIIDLPDVAPRPDPTYEQEPLDEDPAASRLWRFSR